MNGTEVLSGHLWCGDRFEEGHIILEDGMVKEVNLFEYDGIPDITGCILPGIIDTHTHVADAGLMLDRRYGLEELVAPPNGLKHRYLNDTPADTIRADMKRYIDRLFSGGISKHMDFREGGVDGAKMLRSVSDSSFILGRPISNEFDPNEIDEILDIADGIGIPSITDMDHRYIDAVADAVHRKNKMLALHVSERIREDIDYVLSLEPDLIVHMVQATDSDMKKCADHNIPVSVCTTSNLYFGMIPPIKMMIDAGISVSIGTDNAMLFPSADIFTELRTFNDVLTSQGGDKSDSIISLIAHGRKILNEESALEAQTGKKADLVVFPCSENEIFSRTSGSVRYGH